MDNFSEKVSLIWSVADILRGPYRPNQYKDVILPMTVLRRLDCVLEPTKGKLLYESKRIENKFADKITNLEPILCRITGVPFYNTSQFTFKKLKEDPDNIAGNLTLYIQSFSDRAKNIIEHFGFEKQIEKLDQTGLLSLIVSKFCEPDLHPDKVSNIEMGYIFEELIRRFNESSKEEAGDHFTPREVIRLMVNLIFMPDKDELLKDGIVKTLYDPACGTGGMLSVSEDYLRELYPDARLEVFGQDYNSQAYAICGSDMMIKGEKIEHIAFGNSFKEDHFKYSNFDYMLANPPFGVEWKPEAKFIKEEYQKQGFNGRFGAGLPRINDGSLLFLQHMISKMKPIEKGGTRLAIVFNGSPLFTGSAGAGESEIRRWIIENDWLEAVVALPDQLFYNTGIYTYLWILTNRKEQTRKGKVYLINGTGFFKKMRKSLGNKRNEICDSQRDEIVKLYSSLKEKDNVRIFDNKDFGYYRITVERPLRLNFSAEKNRILKIYEINAFKKLVSSNKRKNLEEYEAEIEQGLKMQKQIISALESVASLGIVKDRDEFSKHLKKAFEKEDINLQAPLFNAIVMALGERDMAACVCKNSKGNPEPDPELRDYENVPLKEDINDYMKKEVLPYLPDAWVDESKTKIGYEINFNRYFYKYSPPRPIKEIESDLKEIEDEIARMLEGV